MKPRGYELIVQTLQADEEIDIFEVYPKPAEGEDLPLVAIVVKDIYPARLFDVLQKARLMQGDEQSEDMVDAPGLKLSVAHFGSGQRGIAAEFWDLKVKSEPGSYNSPLSTALDRISSRHD